MNSNSLKLNSPIQQVADDANYFRITPILTTSSNPINIVETINNYEARNFKYGCLLLLISISTWVIGLELVNSVLKSDDYNKPWLFATITGSCFIINCIPDLFILNKVTSDEELQISKSSDNNIKATVQMSNNEVVKLAIQISIIYYMYNLLVMEALQFTSASNQTVIGSLTSVFTLIIGICLKTERFSIQKLVCVFCSSFGVYLINLGDPSSNNENNAVSPKNSKLGNFLALCGALLYTFYLLIMKYNCGSGLKQTNERRLFGIVGLITIIFGWPTLYIVHLLGIETFEFPPLDKNILVFVFINGIFSVISDYTSIIAMLLTSPLVVSLTLTSSIPITIFIDYLILYFTNKSMQTTFTYIFGIACILVAVLLINLNINFKKNLINEIIDETIEQAIKEDETMSPILSPLLPSQNMIQGKLGDLNSEEWQLNSQNLTFNMNHQDTSQDLILINGGQHKYYIKRN
ncbi:unnamed protein product [Candida verbasci]|uniref:EamA domain-containing protein n=1 Tax=Candida verbasci TaxID=1227364 RepID=A0A9W4XHX8_9ASCO|nr:unnamed protein product [Candida verbasci]